MRSFAVCVLVLGLSSACSSTVSEPGSNDVDGGGSGGSSSTMNGTPHDQGSSGSEGSTGSGGRMAMHMPTGQAGMQGNSGSGGAVSSGGGATSGSGGQSGGGNGNGSGGSTGSAGCFDAKQLWFDDFETNDYSRWTGMSYDNEWGDNCQSTAISTEDSHSPSHAERSEIVCKYTADNVQRGYGGIQFSGDTVLPRFTNSGVGLDAPNGVVTVMWMKLVSPTSFADGKWVSFWTSSASCDWSDEVMTIGIEDSTDRIGVAHYAAGGGTRTFENDAPALPRGTWVRITVYINYYDGVMHVWQDGKSVEAVTFNRALKTICQFHWGLYANADNDNIVLYEDDKSLWKLNAKWTDFSKEPYLGGDYTACN
jgi:hypothetical protein